MSDPAVRLLHPDGVTWYYRHYFSTYCIHELHDQCRLTCKHCPEECRCECHRPPEQQG